MGTNYYIWVKPGMTVPNAGECELLHIGKSSMGWVFSLRVYPERGINTLYDWLPIILNSNNAIRDEYLRHITAHEMLETITCRSRDVSPDWTPKEWEMNHAEPGPNNLVRGRIVKEFDPGRTHGEGTWDYCNYEFC
jgi:hypothetical protein